MNMRLRTRLLCGYLLLAPMLASAAPAQLPPAQVAISAPDSGWVLYREPMPGVDALLVPKNIDSSPEFKSNINLTFDRTNILYRGLDSYTRVALEVLKSQPDQTLKTVQKKHLRNIGDYYLIASSRGSIEVIQAVLFKQGRGFYILTGTFDPKVQRNFEASFQKVLEGARFQ